MSITAALARHAQERGDRTALVFEDDAITYRALDAEVTRIAAWIGACAGRGGSVALDLPNGQALALLYLGVARAGCEAQFLDPEWPDGVRGEVLDRLRPGLVVTSRAAIAEGAMSMPAARFAAVADAAGAPASCTAVEEPNPLVPFYVGFTSGSTGRPKGYRRHHRSWLMSFAGEAVEFGTGSADVVLVPGALTHSLSVYALTSALHHGATAILMRRFRPDHALAAIRRHGATLMHAVPTQIAMMAQEAARSGPARSVRMVTSSGARLSAGERESAATGFPEARIAEFYGASELSFVTVAHDGAEGVGRPFPGVAVTIRDIRGRRLPAGRRGTVFVESPLAFMDYATGEEPPMRFGHALSVGDRGFLDAAGRLHLVGRGNRMIIVSGRNIHPEGIERAIIGLPEVEDAGVFGVPDARRGERVAAMVRLHRPLRRADLMRALRRDLPGYRLPADFRVLDDWPRTASGKTDFPRLAALWAAGEGRPLG